MSDQLARLHAVLVNGGVKTFHWGGAKAGHLGARALDRVALI